jgi:type II secretory pathway component PulM
MRAWFASLEARERMIVAVGGAAAALIIVWGLIWLPLDRAHDGMRTSVGTWEQSLTELKMVGARLAASGDGDAGPRVVSNESPVVIVDRTLRERGLNRTVKRQQPVPNGIRVEFESVAFDDLVLWLGALENDYAMTVQAASLSAASQAGPGRVNASLTLERAL